MSFVFAAYQSWRRDYHGREHPGRSETEEARHYESEGGSWMGTKDQAERWTASNGGWFQGKASSAKKELNFGLLDDEHCCCWELKMLRSFWSLIKLFIFIYVFI